MHKQEKVLWICCVILTILTGAINSVLVVFFLQKIVEVILQNGIHAPRFLFLFILSVLAGALLETLRQKIRYVLYRIQLIRLEDKLICTCYERGRGGDKAFVLIQNTVNDLAAQRTDWVLECSGILGVSVILGIYIGSISITALVICLVVVGIAILLMWSSSRKISDAARASNEKMNAVYGEMWNYLKCIEILPFLHSKVYGKFEERMEENQQKQILLGKYTNIARICKRFGSVGITLIAIVYFGMLTINKRFILSDLLAVTMLLPNFAEDLLQIPDCISQHKKLMGMWKNVNVFLEEDKNREADRKIKKLNERIRIIEISNVSYSYQDGRCNCRVDNFLAQNGRITGICGESGSGKTTLLRIILGELQGDGGEYFVNGQRVECFDRRELWSHILYLPQDSILLPVNMKGNITLTSDNGQIDEKRYTEALRKAGIEELAAVKGKDILDESILSDGEIQKVCLARCFYTDKEVLILDEATNAMSPGAESKILHNLVDEVRKKDKILIIVSHDPAVIGLCDRTVRIQRDA